MKKHSWIMLACAAPVWFAACAVPPEAGAPSSLVEPQPSTPAAPAAASSDIWRARGNEPGWVLTRDGETMTLSYDYGSGTYSAPEPAPVPVNGGQQWTDTAGALTVTSLDTVCADNMTGMPHPATVTVSYGDRVFQGCGGEPAALLAGKEWNVEEIDGAGVIKGSTVTIAFDAQTGRAGGRGSCNAYSAPFTLTGESLTFGPVISTQMACEDPLMRQENALHEALGAATGFQIREDGALVLTANEQGRVLARR